MTADILVGREQITYHLEAGGHYFVLTITGEPDEEFLIRLERVDESGEILATHELETAPLVRHCLRQARESPGPDLPAVWPRRGAVDGGPRLVLFRMLWRRCQPLGRTKLGQVSEVEAGRLECRVTEPPRLHCLCCRSEVLDSGLGVLVHDRVFDADTLDGSVPAGGEEVGTLFQLVPHLLERPTWWRLGEPEVVRFF